MINKHRLDTLRRLMSIARPYNSLLPSLAIAVGFLVSRGTNTMHLALAVVAYILLHSSITIWNDYEDRAVDELNGVASFSMASGWRTRQKVTAVCLLLIALATICASFLPLFSVIALASFVICGWIYNAAPLRLSRRPIGSVVVLFFAYGILPFSVGVGLHGNETDTLLPVALLAFSWGLLRVSLSVLKDYKDAVGDAEFGKRTFLLRYGATAVWKFSVGASAFGFVLAIVALRALGLQSSELVVLVVVACWLMYERMALIGKHKNYAELNGTFHRCLHYQLIFDGLVIACLLT